MASKTQVDNKVNERRLRPIYDSLDNGNNKKALQEADKVLRKQPGNQCARVLKALALLRLGKENECQVIMDKVRSEIPCEDSTLQVMTICYKEIQQQDKISEIYEAALKADPNNEDLLTHLFMSYVRLGDYKKQQQTAYALYKLKPRNPYYFWAVMSIVMQAMHSDEKLAKGVTLPLAERMVLKFVKDDRMEAEQEVQLYLMILELQGKNEKMLEVLLGPLASHLTSVPQHKAALLLKLECYPEAANAYKDLIIENVDNWAYYQDYLSAALKFQKPAVCLDFFNDIISTLQRKVRAPYLARFELIKRTSLGEDVQSTMSPVDLMYRYFSIFGEKSCVVADLRLYLDLLRPLEKYQLLQMITGDFDVDSENFPSTVCQMKKHIHLEQLRRLCGFHHPPVMDLDEQEHLIKQLCQLYKKGNELCPVDDRLPTDFCPADSYILLATHLLHQLWVETNEASYLYRAMALLERSLLTSPANFHTKILLVRIYLEAGLIGVAHHIFSLLDVKHIQLDSLGYLHAPLVAPLGHLSLASETLDQSEKFFVANYSDSADHLTFAYKYGSFIKIQEFVDLRERLKNSLHSAMTSVDKMLLELSSSDSSASLRSILAVWQSHLHEHSIRWDCLRDNRDLEVVCGWEPIQKSVKDPRMHKETRECMLRLLAARNLILRILATAAEPDSSTVLSQLSTELKEVDNDHIPLILRKFDAEEKINKSCNILVPLDAVERLREAHYSEQLKTVACLAEFLSHSPVPYPDQDCIQMLRTSPCLQPVSVPEQDTPVSYKTFLLRASTCSESLAIISAICVACASQQQSRATHGKNKKKYSKNVEAILSDENNQTWGELAALLAERVRNLDTVLSEFEKCQLYTGLDSGDKIDSVIMKHGQESLGQSCRCLKSRSQLTLKLLGDLKS